MTRITLDVPDELAARLEPLHDQLPRLLSMMLDLSPEEWLVSLTDLQRSQQDGKNIEAVKAKRLAALAEARAIGERIHASQEQRGVQDIDSVTLLDDLRKARDRDLTSLY